MPVSILLLYNQLTVHVSNKNQIPIDPVGNAFILEKYRYIKTSSVSYNVFNKTLFRLV